MIGRMADVKAVIFDWGGTLTPWHEVDVERAWDRVAHAIDPRRVAELAGKLAEAEQALWQRARTDHVSGTVADVFALAEETLVEDALAGLYDFWEPHTLTDPDVPELFRGLRERGIKVGVLSNTIWPRDQHERIFARDGVLELIDGAVYTSEIPYAKPHPEAFRAALAAVAVDDPAQAVYVGDRLFEDVYGPQAIGMRAVHIPLSTVPEHQRGHTEGTPDAVVRRLADLLPVVDGWRAA